MLLYSHSSTPRLQYALQFIGSIVGQPFLLTTDIEAFTHSRDIKINYSEEKLHGVGYHIQPHTLLFQTTIDPIEINIVQCRGNACFFTSKNDNHGFDVFAAIFYLLSRYEEYLPHEKDVYGRYAHINSVAYKNNFLALPVVNFWVQDLMRQLQIADRELSIVNRQPVAVWGLTTDHSPFTFCPTYDIDIAYAYRYQPLWKNVGGFFKDLANGNFEKLMERANVYSGTKPDPFDVYDWLHTMHKHYQLSPVYFFLLAKKRGIYDRNISPRVKGMQQLVKKHAAKYKVGIHPSWQSGDEDGLLVEEIKSLQHITQQPCIFSRQHYIRLTLPKTYRALISTGITEDYSMGYGSINGFRASVASPFFWYDLERDEATKMLLRPFCYMEANSFFEQHFSAEEAAEELQQYHDVVKQAGGQLVTICHNHFLTTQPQWEPWRKMYAAFLKKNFS
ncbi:DUF7033 domain-containing protein [Parasediminibacterium sp. JCM 36343]|uniref:DUF7033 domain-containing protein n=1 Tax=Parasediminibacterium sp. JCM 36343 TaxID=3374279 RepID=UPI00397946D7